MQRGVVKVAADVVVMAVGNVALTNQAAGETINIDLRHKIQKGSCAVNR